MNSTLRAIVRDYVPPVGIRAIRRLRTLGRGADFEFVGHSWPTDGTPDGWDTDGVADYRAQTWDAFVASVQSSQLLGITDEQLRSPSAISTDVQGLYLAFAYAVARTSGHAQSLSMLDWGGSTGNYFVIGRELFPDIALSYHCVDLPAACALGRRLLPEVTFHDGNSWERGRYDLVFSSSAIQYVADWRRIVTTLIGTSKRTLFVTRMPFLIAGQSFVALQRVEQYRTSYFGWVLNRDEFIQHVEGHGMTLIRQIVNHPGPVIKGAPSPNLYMGFLFER